MRFATDRPGLRALAIMAALVAAFLAVMAANVVTAFAQAPEPEAEPERPPQYQGHGSEAENMRLATTTSMDGPPISR